MRSLTLFITALLITVSASAQKFEIGINGGLAFNSLLRGAPQPSNTGNTPATAPAISIKGSYLHKKWQYGLSVDYRHAYLQEAVPVMEVTWGTNGTFAPGSGFILMHQTFECIPVTAFVNRRFTYRRIEWYTGLSAGYTLIHPGSKLFGSDEQHTDIDHHGYTAALQGGATFFITKHIGINAEAAASYLYMTSGQAGATHMLAIPTTVGLRYRL